MAAADVDTGYIAGHLGLDQPVLTSLTTQPTVELVSTLLQAVAAKAHEFDELYAAKLQTDIELENVVRSSESLSSASKATADKALKDLEDARQKLREEENKRQTVENELQSLRAKDSGHDDEIKALSDKIETLQSSNRTNLSIIESNNKRDQTLSEELTKQHQKNVELSREITSLQQAEQNAKGQLSSAKYREESLQQQLDLARRNSEWLESELKTKSDEALKYRKEKGARIAELQRQNEDAKSEVEALKRADKQLRDRLSSMQAKADEALVKLQQHEGSFATTIESYKHELDDQRRLVDMSDQLSKKHQERVHDLEGEKERLRDNYEGEIHRVRLELEQERQANAELEEKVRNLEGEVDELHIRAEQQAPPPASAPQTPRANGSLPPRASSPFATPGSIRSKSAVTATQAIEQLYQVKAQLASEKRRSQQLSEELDSMMGDLEAKAPEIQELQSEAETLRGEIARMSELSQQSFEERDSSRRAARKAESTLASAQAEAKILRNQVRDLGTQTQYLVFNIYALEKGMDKLTDEEKLRLEQLERGEITEEALADMSDTHQFITQRLVVFKDIKSLQAKNEELLRITRELAEQIESEEALAAKHQAKQDHDQVEKLQQELVHMTEEAKSIKSTMESYKMERDMFRRILQQRGPGDEASVLRGSLDGSQRFPLTSIEPAEQVESLNEALRKLQSEYDSFRDAQDGVRKDLRDQIEHLTAEKSSLQTERIKLQGEVRLESERREMLQSNYVALQNENTELQKRSQALSETAAKQDIRTQQVAEELIESKGLLDSMRNETANLKAEKKLWNDIHVRMTKDNEGLIEEKNRLNNLLSTQQSLENERAMTESEARRRAQARVETLERELSDTQRRLNSESEETKKLQLRKEYEVKEAQKRIDELMASLSQLREEHVGVKTTRDHLQARVDELTVELRSAEDRVGRLQPRPTPRPGPPAANGNQELEAEIQDLNNEVADLKRELDLTKTHLDNAKAQAEQYKELSQSNEEALEDLRSSQGQYQQEMEALVEEKNAKVRELEQRIDDMSSELSRSNTELSTLRDSQGEVARRFQDEKAILEEEVARLKEETARHMEAARFHQQDLRAQADIATKAQQDYEQELVKHAEAAKLVQQLRNDYNELKSQTASLRTEAESARVTLAQSEGSWEDQRQRLEQEIDELKTRRKDVDAQNKLLHQQLESLTSQVNSLQQSRDAEGGDEAMSPVAMGDVSEGLRELNSYLRREKEILEVQYDLKTQESKRLQQQLEYTQSQLDETKLKLDQERSQAAQSGRTSMTHQDLMEKLNELNLYRESSMTLRNENTRLKELVTEKTRFIEEAEAKVQPLEAEIDTLKTQKSFLEDEIKQVQEDRDRWQKRTEGILTKYGRVDPAEMEGLKETISKLEAECGTLKEAEQPLRDQLAEMTSTLETERSNWQTTRSKLTEQFKERSRKLTGERNDAMQRINELQEQLTQKTTELENAQKQAEASTTQTSELQKQIDDFKRQVDELRSQAGANAAAAAPQDQTNGAPAAPAAPPAEASASNEVVAQLEQQLTVARKELEALNAQKLGAEQQLESLRSELQSAVAERDEAIQKLQEASAAQQATAEQPAPPSQTADVGAVTQSSGSGLSDDERKALEEKIAAAEAKAAEFEKKASEVETNIQQAVKERSDRMKDTLNAKLRDRRAQMDEEFKLKLEQEKAIWKAENASGPTPVDTTAGGQQPPATPKTESQSGQSPATPSSASGPPDLSQVDDATMRQFLSTNTMVKSIIAANVKKRVEAEQAKASSELESKIAAAREQAQMLESKKSTLRINMSENKLRAASAKLGVVETAAKDTPQKPVVEVWEVAKKANAAATPASTPSTPAKPPAAAAKPAQVPQSPAVSSTPAQAQATGTPNPAGAAAGAPAPQGNGTQGQEQETPAAGDTPAQKNPFEVASEAAGKEAPNPFAASTSEQPAATPQAQGQKLPNKPQQPTPGQGQAHAGSSLPMPRGGGRGRGSHVAAGQRNASGGHTSGLPQPGRGGRGGARGGRGGATGLNPNSQEFQPGAKRPRGDSEAGAGAKRARGSH